MVDNSNLKPETKRYPSVSTCTAGMDLLAFESVHPQWVGEIKRTRVEGLHVEVTDSVPMAGLFGLLRQQPVHSSDGGGHVVRSQVKGRGLFTRLLLQHRHNVVTLPRDAPPAGPRCSSS